MSTRTTRQPRTLPTTSFRMSGRPGAIAAAILFFTPVAGAQEFHIFANPGLSFGGPAECAFNFMQDTPVEMERGPCPFRENSSASSGAIADRGLVHSRSSVTWPATCGCTLGIDYGGDAWFRANIIFSGPPGPAIPVEWRVDVDAAESGPSTYTRLWIEFSGGPRFDSDTVGDVASGRYTLAHSVPPNTTVPVLLYVVTGAAAGSLVPATSSASVTARLPIGEPVFILPPGYTANSPDLNIVNNIWNGQTLCRADFNDDNTVNSADFFSFLTAFFTQDPAADFSGDGQINSQDLFDFLGAFFAGC
jgi:hypothetical protein